MAVFCATFPFTSLLCIVSAPLLFGCCIVSDSLQPHGLPQARLPCPSPAPALCSDSCPLSQWGHLMISSSSAPFSLSPQSFPAVFPVSQLFTLGGQSIGASASVLPVNIQSWFPVGVIGLISLLSKGLSRVFSSTTVQKHQFFGVQPSLWSISHICTWLLEKSSLWLYGSLSAKWCPGF